MDYITKGKYLIVDIHKPLGVQEDYDFVRVRKEYFVKAKKLKRFVLVRSPHGERVFDPSKMKEFKIVKQVFLIPSQPMELYELTIPRVDKCPLEYYEFQ